MEKSDDVECIKSGYIQCIAPRRRGKGISVMIWGWRWGKLWGFLSRCCEIGECKVYLKLLESLVLPVVQLINDTIGDAVFSRILSQCILQHLLLNGLSSKTFRSMNTLPTRRTSIPSSVSWQSSSDSFTNSIQISLTPLAFPMLLEPDWQKTSRNPRTRCLNSCLTT